VTEQRMVPQFLSWLEIFCSYWVWYCENYDHVIVMVGRWKFVICCISWHVLCRLLPSFT